MKYFTASAFGAVAASLLGSTALADISATQAWEDLQAYSSKMGQTITGTESVSGGTLTVSNVVMSAEVPDAKVNMSMDTMTFSENGDGSVTITMSPKMTMKVEADPADGAGAEDVDMTMEMTQTDLAIIAKGDGDARSYDFSATKLNVAVTEMIIDDKPVDMSISVDAMGMLGNYASTAEDATTFSGAGTVDMVTYAIDMIDPESSAKIKMTGDSADLATSSVTSIPDQADPMDLAAMLKAGFTSEGRMTYGASTFNMEGDENGDQFKLAYTMSGGNAGYTLNDKIMAFDTGYDNFDVVASGSEIPFPQVTAKIADLDLGMSMPVTQGAEPQPFSLLTSFKGLEVDNMLWSMIDPAGQLPRDPANLVIDLAGTGNWLIDIFDEKAAVEADVPGQLHSLNINGLELSVAGAALTGGGAFTFDNTDLTSYDGMPKPVGKLNLRLVGGNTLLDTLVNMGLVPQDQAMGVRMMSGMFARPGDGQDTLLSEIEMTEEGGILANGQRLQ